MSAPIVERLRDRGVCSIAQNSCRNDWVCEEAATTIEDLLAELSAAKGYMLNARFDLETGTKAAGIVTINGGIKRIDAAIAKAKGTAQ